MFWVNPYSQRSQRHCHAWPLDEAKAREAAKWQALQRELLEVRRELDGVKLALAARRAAQQRELEIQRRKSDLAWDQFIRTFKRYADQQKAGFNPDQPRDDHGKWTDGGRSGDAGKVGGDHARSTDISAQRRIGPRPTGTPTQHARLDAAIANAREAVARVQRLDPNWRSESATSFDHRSSMEVMIRAKEAETREAEARFIALSRARQDVPYPMRDPPTTAEVLMPGGDLVGHRAPRAGKDVRTVTPAEFENIRVDLMGGARQIEPTGRYDGVWYRREDKSEFGLRIGEHGLTLELIRSEHPLLPNGLKVHQR
jgi:hypothetical protein